MIVLTRIALALMLVLSAVIAVVVVAAGQQPLPDTMSVLHFDLCQPPCWIGITPGETSLDTAITRTRQFFGRQGYTVTLHQTGVDRFLLSFANSEQPFPGSINFRTTHDQKNNQIIDAVEFYLSQPDNLRANDFTFFYTFLDAYRQFGNPSAMGFWMRTFNNLNGSFVVYGKGKILVIGKRETGNTLLQRQIQGITFQAQAINPAEQVRWRGFGSINRYYTEWLSINP